MKTFTPGLLLAAGVSILAGLAARWMPGPGSLCWAILIGILIGNLIPFGTSVDPGLRWVENRMLPVAIALMGTELQLQTLGRLGVLAFWIVFPAMLLSIGVSLLLGRWLKLPLPAALVLGIGNSVCGSSAVLAAAPAVKAEKHDVAVAIASVNLAGTVGIFILPALAGLLQLPDLQTSYLIGGSLQAVGQVVAAGFSVSDAIGQNALVIKMLRVLMIGPIVMILHMIFNTKNTTGAGPKKKYIPGYIVGFLICSVVASEFNQDALILPHVKTLAGLLMLVCMAAIGCRIHFRTLLAQGPRALLVVGLLSLIQVASILVLIRIFAVG